MPCICTILAPLGTGEGGEKKKKKTIWDYMYKDYLSYHLEHEKWIKQNK